MEKRLLAVLVILLLFLISGPVKVALADIHFTDTTKSSVETLEVPKKAETRELEFVEETGRLTVTVKVVEKVADYSRLIEEVKSDTHTVFVLSKSEAGGKIIAFVDKSASYAEVTTYKVDQETFYRLCDSFDIRHQR